MILSPKPLFPVLLAVAVTGVTLTACGDEPGSTEPVRAAAGGDPSLLSLTPQMLANTPLETATAGPVTLRRVAQCYGEIAVDPGRIAPIVSHIRGILREDPAQLGDPVTEGQVIAVLESDELSRAIITYLESEQDLVFAEKELEREQELFDKRLTSAEQLQARRQALSKAQIAHAAALQPLHLLHFTEDELHGFAGSPEHVNLTRLVFRAPLTGVVTQKNIYLGESVADSQELLRIADLTEVWVEFPVPLDVADGIAPGTQVTVIDPGEEHPERATVQYVSPLATESTRSVAVRATLANPEGLWRPGTPVLVEAPHEEHEAAVAVPSTAILDHDGGYLVFLRHGEGEFEARPVTIGEQDGEFTEVLHGVVANDTVVTTEAFALKAQWQIQAE